MQIVISLTPEAAERYAKEGTGSRFYSWHFNCEAESAGAQPKCPENHIELARIEVFMPDVQKCRDVALAVLDKKLQEVRAQAYVEEREINERRQNLLALDFTPVTQVTLISRDNLDEVLEGAVDSAAAEVSARYLSAEDVQIVAVRKDGSDDLDDDIPF